VSGGSQCVCIVDDDDGVRNSARRLLEAYDIQTMDYASGSDFLSHYRRGLFGCLILDMYMPGLSGLEILLHLRGTAHDDIPVIVISGQGYPMLKEQVLTAGASVYLDKPIVEADTLVKVVEELLR
jgi:two-component system, chemotaxis family, CheB/CheR fusion protein